MGRSLWGTAAPTAHAQTEPPAQPHSGQTAHGGNIVEGDVDPATNGFDPAEMLTDFDYGKVSTLANGQTLREYALYASDKTIEIAPGVFFPGWVYNGRVPGPTFRPLRLTGVHDPL